MTESDQSTARGAGSRTRTTEPVAGSAVTKSRSSRGSEPRDNSSAVPSRSTTSTSSSTPATTKKASAKKTKTRQANLRLVQVDAWSVMKTSFLLSIAMGIVSVVAVAIIWTVLGAAGVFDSVNSMVEQVMGNTFNVQDYVGTGRILGLTMIMAVVNVVLLTAIATLGAFLYNLAATLLGGIEVTLAEDS